MKLWQVRLSHTKKDNIHPRDYKYREDLAISDSIIMIGYNLSVDVRGFSKANKYAQLNSQLKKNNPNSKGKSEKSYNTTINNYKNSIKSFIEIEAGDYIISTYLNPPNFYKVSIGQSIGKLETLEYLLSSIGGLKHFAQQYPQQSTTILQAGNWLARKVIWKTNIFPYANLVDEIYDKRANGPKRAAVAEFKFAGQMPHGLVKNPNSITWIP